MGAKIVTNLTASVYLLCDQEFFFFFFFFVGRSMLRIWLYFKPRSYRKKSVKIVLVSLCILFSLTKII